MMHAEKQTKAIVIDLPFDLARRLHLVARPLHKPSREPTPPSALARAILVHYCVAPNGIMQRIAREVDPTLCDTLVFMGQVRGYGDNERSRTTIHCTASDKHAVDDAAAARGMTAAALAVKILDRALPPLPKS